MGRKEGVMGSTGSTGGFRPGDTGLYVETGGFSEGS